MQERPDESELNPQPNIPGEPIPGQPPTTPSPNQQPYQSGPPNPPRWTGTEITSNEQYIASTPYPYEPARNDPRAAPDRPNSDYTPNMEASAAASEQMRSLASEQQRARDEAAARAWVRLTALLGRSLLDLENGRRLGKVEDLVLTRDYRFVAGFVAQDAALALPPVYPARGATIGEDAIVLPAASLQNTSPESFKGMPLARRLLDMRLVTVGGKLVGKMTDVRFDPETHEVFLQVEDEGNLLRRLLHQSTVIPATAVQTYGQDVLIVSDAAARQYLGGKV